MYDEQNEQLAQALVGLGATVAKVIESDKMADASKMPTDLVVDTLHALGQQLSEAERAARLQAVRDAARSVSDCTGVAAEWFDGAIVQGSLKADLYGAARRIARVASSRGTGHRSVGTWLCRALAAIAPQDNDDAGERLSEAPSIMAVLERA